MWHRIYQGDYLAPETLTKYTVEEIGVRVLLFCLAADPEHGPKGVIGRSEKAGYTDAALAEMMNVAPSVVARTIRKLVRDDVLRMGKGETLAVTNWGRHESDYDKKRAKMLAEKEAEKKQGKSTKVQADTSPDMAKNAVISQTEKSSKYPIQQQRSKKRRKTTAVQPKNQESLRQHVSGHEKKITSILYISGNDPVGSVSLDKSRDTDRQNLEKEFHLESETREAAAYYSKAFAHYAKKFHRRIVPEYYAAKSPSPQELGVFRNIVRMCFEAGVEWRDFIVAQLWNSGQRGYTTAPMPSMLNTQYAQINYQNYMKHRATDEQKQRKKDEANGTVSEAETRKVLRMARGILGEAAAGKTDREVIALYHLERSPLRPDVLRAFGIDDARRVVENL